MSGPAVEELWTLDDWRSIYTGDAVLLYVDGMQVSSMQVADRAEAEAMARDWRRSVLVLIQLEQEAERIS